MNYDLIIIGSGPAGISAGIQAAKHNAKVVIVDENPVPGGKLLGQLHEEKESGWWIGNQIARDLKEKARKLGVTFMQETEVWGIFPQWIVKLNKREELKAPFVLIATGAAEKPTPIPGWTIPGVMAIGAAQVLNNYYRVRPGNKVAVIGVDPLALTVSRELKMAGADLAGIFLPPISELTKGKSNPKHIISYLSGMSNLAPNSRLKIIGNMARKKFIQDIAALFFPSNGVKVWGIPLLLKKTVVEIQGESHVEGIKVRNIDANGEPKSNSFQTIKADCVCISGGLYPLGELASAVGCKFTYLEELGGYVPLHSQEMETTKEGIFVAGNITGIEGAKTAMAQGTLAGVSICRRLGLIDDFDDSLLKKAKKKVKDARTDSVIQFLPNINQGRKKMKKLWEEHYNPSISKNT